MKTRALLLSLITIWISAEAHAVPAEGGVSRFGVEVATFQEPLRLQKPNGDSDVSVANYKGFFLSFERQKRFKGGGYALSAAYGKGSASGGGTNPSFNYTQGSVQWTMMVLQPRIFMALSDQIDLGASIAGNYRKADWPETSLMRVTSAEEMSGVFFIDLNLSFTDHLGMHQAIGFGNIDVGTFWRWGLFYDF